jgi:hypothetical protein
LPGIDKSCFCSRNERRQNFATDAYFRMLKSDAYEISSFLCSLTEKRAFLATDDTVNQVSQYSGGQDDIWE